VVYFKLYIRLTITTHLLFLLRIDEIHQLKSQLSSKLHKLNTEPECLEYHKTKGMAVLSIAVEALELYESNSLRQTLDTDSHYLGWISYTFLDSPCLRSNVD
jgi:hypothetical protein